MPMGVVLADNAGNAVLPAAAALADNLANPTTPLVGAASLLWDGGQWVRRRVPNTFKFIDNNGSNSTLWTPGAGKKFCLKRLTFSYSMNAAQSVAGVVSVVLKDGGSGGTTIFNSVDTYVPGAALTTTPGMTSPFILDFGEKGFLSAAANNTLWIQAAALTAGFWSVSAFGTEE
jgi:hypothetical protein